MNKKMMIGFASASLVLGAVAVVGNKSSIPFETQAAGTISSVALKGSAAGWSTPVAFENIEGDYVLTKNFAQNEEFKVYITGGGDRQIDCSWGLSNVDWEFLTSGDNDNFKVKLACTLTITVKSTFYTNWGGDVSLRMTGSRTVQFVDSTDAVFTGTDNLVEASEEFSGLLETTQTDAKFRIKDNILNNSYYYSSIEGSADGVNAVVDNGYIKIPAAGLYMVYFKKSTHQCWISYAGTSQVAYHFANFFLDNVGCDPDGQDVPTGWTVCDEKYATLTGDAKDYIYDAEKQAEFTAGDSLDQMIKRYEWAINHNPNGLVHFITNRSGTPREAYFGGSSNVMTDSSQSNNAMYVLVAIAGASLLAAGSFLLLRKKKEQ